MKRRPLIVPLEERIVLDAAAVAVVADAVVSQIANSGAGVQDNVDTTDNTTDATTQDNVIYVNENADGAVQDGKSWETAYTDLQDALDTAAQTPGKDQIWIAEGTYKPSERYAPDGIEGGVSGATGDNLKTFDIPDNVELYGGFVEGMVNLSQRKPGLHATVLSGDLLGNDINDPTDPGYAASKADNAWHVIMMGNDVSQTGVTARLDGLIIENGYANGPGLPLGEYAYNHNFGGGAYIAFDSDVVIKNVTFRYNYAASDGGGLYSNNSDILVSHSHFHDNTAVIRAGAYEALNTFETSPHTATVTDSLFENNVSYVFGGALVGEGTYPDDGSSFVVDHSVFVGNEAAEGGAIVLDTMTTFVNDSFFYNNLAHVNGGALATTSIVNTLFGGRNDYVTTITGSHFVNNVAEGDVAAHQYLNGLFSGNGLEINFARGGGALVSYMTGRMVVDTSLFVGNVAESGDGGAILNGGSLTTIFGGPFAASAETTVNKSWFIGNQAWDGNGGAIASTSLLGLLDPETSPFANTLNVYTSKFSYNTASGNGGAMYLSGATAEVVKNIFFRNNDAGGLGDQIFATDSDINDEFSSSLDAFDALDAENIFQLLSDDDITLL